VVCITTLMIMSSMMIVWMHTQVMTNVVIFHDSFGCDGHRSFGTMCIKDMLIVVVLKVVLTMSIMGRPIWARRQHVQLIDIKVGRQ